VLRFGRTLRGEWSGFVTLDPEASPDEVIAIALLGPLANLGTAPLFAAAAQSGGISGALETAPWLVAATSVLTAPSEPMFGYVFLSGGHRTKAF
jgi:hypothetical protein